LFLQDEDDDGSVWDGVCKSKFCNGKCEISCAAAAAAHTTRIIQNLYVLVRADKGPQVLRQSQK